MPRAAPCDRNRKARMLTKTMVDTQTTEPAIVAATQAFLAAMLAEFAAVFRKARACGELPQTANPERLARRFQSNVTALRLALHPGKKAEEFKQLAKVMAQEIEQLRVQITD